MNFLSNAFTRRTLASLAAIAAAVACADQAGAQSFGGAVYSLSNKANGNTVAAFGRNADGSLSPIGEFATGGFGGTFDTTGDGLDPLISEDALISIDNRFLLAVNAGSDTISSFRINPDFSLSLTRTISTGGSGPASIAYRNGRVYVANIDSDGSFQTVAEQSGNVTGFQLNPANGQLSQIPGSTRQLGTRPSDVEFSSDGNNLVVASYNAGASGLPGGSLDEVAVYGVGSDGNLTADKVGTGISTLPGNAQGRNLAGAIGAEIVRRGGQDYLVATESREFLSNGDAAPLAQFQVGSLSTWRLEGDGSLTPVSQDVRSGPELTSPNVTDAPTSSCWITNSPDGSVLWVANASGGSITTFALNEDGTLDLTTSREVIGNRAMPDAANPLADADGFTDITISSDGQHVYQLYGLKGTIDVYQVGDDGSSLSLQQQTSGLLPSTGNVIGLVSVDAVPEPSSLALLGLGGLGLLRRRRN